MKSRNFSGQQVIHFRHWSRKSYAIFNSLKNTIKISTLNVALTILTLAVSQLSAQVDQQAPSAADVELNELEVTAQAEALVFAQVGRVITTITQKEIEQAPVSNLADLLSFVQSVDIRQRGGLGIQADVSIRGGSFDQVLILLNGIPISDPQTGHFNLNIPVDLSNVYKVEILKGPGARTFGPNAYSGAINIITKPSKENSIAARISGGQNSLFHGGASTNLNLKNWKTLLSYDYKSSDGYIENTDFKNHQAFLHSELKLKKAKVDAQVGFLKKDFGANSFYSPKYVNQYEINESRFASLGIHFGEKVKVSILPYYRQHRDNWQLTKENPELYQNFHQTDVLGGRVKMIFNSKLGKTTLGLNIKNENLKSSSMGEKMESAEKISWSSDNEFKYQYERSHAGLYIEQRKAFAKKWNASFGLLAHWYKSTETEVNIYPGADLSYHINNELKLFASVNNAMRLPTFTDLFYKGPSNLGNTELKPENSLSMELGVSYLKEGYQIEAAVFRRYGKDIIDWVWQDSIWQTQNITEITTNGIEISAQVKPSILWNIKPWKNISVDYTYLDLVKRESDILSKYALNNLRHQLNIKLQFQIIRNVFLDIQSSYKDRLGTYQTYDFANKTYVDNAYEDYWAMSAKISWNYKQMKLFVKADNINDVKTIEFGVPQPGLWIMGGITYKLKL